MASKKTLVCSVITKEGPILRSIKIEHIEIPSVNGYVSIYADHCPYIVSILYGELRIYDEENKLINMYVDGGIAEVTQNVIAVLVKIATYPKDIDVESLKEKIDKLSKQMTINAEEKRRNNIEIDKYKKQIEIASK
ncbi:F0F1 ATP synthase subunit epsilon [Brachyspira pilosicoli]|uniref:F0F1 ATP synthase subunit epsilon n=1 Tax=Brachyspira pilosicoli TaxID=52584 RepID=UPI003005551A